MIYEIHTYHFNPDKFLEYKNWVVNECVPYLRANLDLVGFYIGDVEPPLIDGTTPMKLELGSANAMWIARWESMEVQKKTNETMFSTEEWRRIWADHPDQNGYLHYEHRFTEGY